MVHWGMRSTSRGTYSRAVTRVEDQSRSPVLASAERGWDMDAAPRALARQDGGSAEATTTRIGAVALPLGVILIAVSEVFHPSREDPMDFPAVFEEYAQNDVWTTVHLGTDPGFATGIVNP